MTDTPMSGQPSWLRAVITGVAVSWSLFQLMLPQIILLDQVAIRSVHLAFAVIMAFLIFPAGWKRRKKLDATVRSPSALVINCLLGAVAAIASLYLLADWQGIATRAGLPILRDFIFGIVAVVLVLEASRRVVGPALAAIALLFTLYAFLGPYFPDLFAFKGVSLTKYMTQAALSTEGIYGIPLGVSASIVFLFVLLGALLEKAGAGKFFINLTLGLLGKFRGGPAKAAVFSSGLMGMISGSSVANIVTTGTFTIPLMKDAGYPPKKAAAIEVAASTDGQLMPPIMGAAAFIIAEYINLPYIQVIKAAAIPALASYAALFYITHLEAVKLGIGIRRSEIPPIRDTLKTGIQFLIPLIVLMVELLGFRHSPELSAFRAILSLFMVILFQEFIRAAKEEAGLKVRIKRSLQQSLGIIVRGCRSGTRNMVSVAIATAVAGLIVGIVNLGIGGMITHIVEILSGGNILILLLITAAASLLLGMGLPTTATYIVMASLTAPIIVEVGGNHGFMIPLIAAHLFCFYFGILADDTPPVGLASYAAAALAGSEPIPTGLQGFFYDLRTAIIPFMFVLNPDILLVGIVHPLSMVMVLVMTVVAAISFTSLLQGWLLMRNRWYDSMLLALAALLLFQPGLLKVVCRPAPGDKLWGYGAGLVFFCAVMCLQRFRSNRINFRNPGIK